MERRLTLGQWLHVSTGTLDGNSHGSKFTTLRNTWQIVRMGSHAKQWTLCVYRSDGRAHQLMISFPRWRGEWPAEHERKEPRP